MTNNIPAVATTRAPSTDMNSGGWGAIENLETTDLLVPKVLHQQALSKFVQEGKARPGDFCDSLTGDVLAKKDEALEVVIFGTFKTMLIESYDPVRDQYKYKETVTITPDNAREWASVGLTADTPEGKLKYNLRYNYYCLLPAKLAELPYVLTLGSKKTRAAKKLNTMLYKLSQLKKPGAAVVFELRSTAEKNERGSWFGIDIGQGRNTESNELAIAHAWYLKSQSQKFTVVEEETAVATEADNEEDDINY